MRLLVVGATGPIGVSLVRAAIARGVEVITVARSAASLAGAEHILADRDTPGAIRDVVVHNRIDTVVDVVAYTAISTGPLLDSLDGLIERYVLLSSADVYRNYELLTRQASGAPLLGPAAETAELRHTRFPYRDETAGRSGGPAWLADYDKIPIEQSVQRMRSAWTILRLPMVYGPGDIQRRFAWAVSPMRLSASPLRIHPVYAHWSTTYGYIDDIGAAIALACEGQVSANRIYNLGEVSPITQLQWAHRIKTVLGWQGDVLEDAEVDQPPMDLSVPLLIDTRRIRDELGFREPTSLNDAIIRTAEDYAPG